MRPVDRPHHAPRAGAGGRSAGTLAGRHPGGPREPSSRRVPRGRRDRRRDRQRAARRHTVRGAAPRASSRRTGRPGWSCWGRAPSRSRRLADRRAFVAAAAADDRRALANNRYSADVVAIACATDGSRGPARPAVRQYAAALAGRDGGHTGRRPARGAGGSRSTSTGRSTLVLVGVAPGIRRRRPRARPWSASPVSAPSAADPRGELLVAGRTSAATARLARAPDGVADAGAHRGTRPADARRRPAAAGLGPRHAPRPRRTGQRSGAILATLADAAIVDSRVLLAHHYGSDEAALAGARGPVRLGPAAARRHRRSVAARTDRIGRRERPIPVLLGGHTLVGPGLRLVARPAHRSRASDGADTRPAPDAARPISTRCRRGRGARRPDPRRDRARRTDDLRPVHGPRPVRPRGRLLPRRRTAARPRQATSSRRPRPTRSSVARWPGPWPRPGSGWASRPTSRCASTAPGPGHSVPRSWAVWRPRHPRPSATIRYAPIEVEPRRLAAIETRLRGRRSHRSPACAPGPAAHAIEGIVLANEVLDALPTHRVIGREDGVARDRSSARAGRRTSSTSRSTALDARARGPSGRRRRRPRDGQTWRDLPGARTAGSPTPRPVCAAACSCSSTTATPPPELYDPRRRRDGTLRAYLQHQVHDDPYVHVGRQDLTAHVDVTRRRTRRGRRRA